jgi:hypothetical protein
MRIYWIKAQAPRRVLALVKHLGVKAEFVEVDMMAGGFKMPDYVALNPNMKAPTLVDGDLVLWEASAIMAHLCIKRTCGRHLNRLSRSRYCVGSPGTTATGRLRSRRSTSSTSSRRRSEWESRTASRSSRRSQI